MSTTAVVVIIVAAVVVLALALWAVRRATAPRRIEKRREHADELRAEERGHRVAAHNAQAESDRLAAEANQARAEAEQQVAIARQREADAEEHARLAEARHSDAADSRRRADELDPHGEGAPRARRPEPRGAEDGVTDEGAGRTPTARRL